MTTALVLPEHTPQFWWWYFKPMEYPLPSGRRAAGMSPHELAKGRLVVTMVWYHTARNMPPIYPGKLWTL